MGLPIPPRRALFALVKARKACHRQARDTSRDTERHKIGPLEALTASLRPGRWSS
jgi:hypothetical protein